MSQATGKLPQDRMRLTVSLTDILLQVLDDIARKERLAKKAARLARKQARKAVANV